jgi:hypothetical protein
MAFAEITAAALTPRFLRNASLIGQRFGPQVGLEYFFYQITPPGIAAFLRLNGFGRVAALRAASASDVARIIRDPWILAATKSNSDAIFLYGPGFTPDVYDQIVRIINQLPGTRGSRIDLVNTGRLAGLSNAFLFVLSVVENPGQAGAAALGVSPYATYADVGNTFVRQFIPGLPPNLFANSGATAQINRLFGGPVS